MAFERLTTIYSNLLSAYGPQHWWPAESVFEMMIGAILTQNTSWKNVESALDTLGRKITPHEVCQMDPQILAKKIRPSGYYNMKAIRLKELANWCIKWGYCPTFFEDISTPQLRKMLLGITGVGKETADSILLYGLERPVFVVDAYTRRMLSRMFSAYETDFIKMDYDEIAEIFHKQLPKDLGQYNEYHALIVRLCKEHCTKAKPDCIACPVRSLCQQVDRCNEI